MFTLSQHKNYTQPIFFVDKHVYNQKMSANIPETFRVALIFLLEKRGRGTQNQLATEKEIDRGYLNAISKGRRAGSDDVRQKISDYFGFTYEQMLSLGRHILDGKDPETWLAAKPRDNFDNGNQCNTVPFSVNKYVLGCEKVQKLDVGRKLLDGIFFLAENDDERLHIIIGKVLEEVRESKKEIERKNVLPKGQESKKNTA